MALSLLSRVNPVRLLRQHPAILSAIACLLIGLALGGMFARQALRAETPGLTQPGQIVAQQITGAALQAEGVMVSSGAYIPGQGIVLYTQVDRGDRSLVRAWVVNQMLPFADRLTQLPKAEKLTWIIDFPPAGQEIIQSPLQRGADPAAYTFIASPNRLVAIQPTAQPAPIIVTQVPAVQEVIPTAVPQPAVVQPTAIPAVVSGPAVVVVTATAIPVATPVVTAVPVVVSSSSFETNADRWTSLSGKWAVVDGTYVQSDVEGFDYLSVLDTPPLAAYRVSVRLRIDSGEMGGGFIYNMPDPTKRDGAQLIDFANQGKVLRWGHYQPGGAFQFDGGIDLAASVMDGNWHTLELITRGTTTDVNVNGKLITTVTNVSKSGRIGLTTSRARVSFDDLQLISQDATK